MDSIRHIRTRKELEQELQAMRESLQELAPLPEEGKSERLARALKDPFYFFKTYFPHYCTHDFAPNHKWGVKQLNIRGKHFFIAADPRDWAKTVIYHTLYPIHQGVFKRRNFYLHVGKTEELATDTLEFIQLEFEDNPRLRQDFGDLVTRGGWESGDFRIKSGMRFKSVGLRGTLRGWRFKQYRPDLIGCDDLDDDERVLNKALIDKDIMKLTRALYGALDTDRGTMFVTGNIISRRGIIARLIKEFPNIISKIVQAIYVDKAGNEHSSWPGRFSLEALRKIRALIGSIAWEGEYQNNPVEESDVFQKEWFRGATRSEIKITRTVQYLDPAFGQTKHADFRAHIVMGIDANSGDYIVLDAVLNRDSLSGMVDTSYALHERHKTVVCGMEDVLFQKLLWKDYKTGVKRHKYALPNKGIENTVPKPLRIESMSGPIELGQLRFLGLTWVDGEPHFENPHMKELYEQYIYYPNSKLDGPDAVAGAFGLMEKYARDPDNTYKGVSRKGITPKRRVRA